MCILKTNQEKLLWYLNDNHAPPCLSMDFERIERSTAMTRDEITAFYRYKIFGLFFYDLKNGYLLYGKLLKRGKFLRRTKFLFNAQNQREFTKVTSEASFRSKFKYIAK